MKKIIQFLSENMLLVATLVLIAFIPLYPKLPIIGVQHTWVYIRLDDFLVAFALFLWGVQFLRKKASLRTPLTIPIIAFWIIGFISTLYSIVFYFPHLPNVFPSIAILYALRQVEYMALFFLAFSAMRKKHFIHLVVVVITVTLLLVVGYGYGQRFDPGHFPAFSTMNEEFAKGIPLKLSPLGRVQSTFAGHYDLAAYLVMIIPLLGSLIFGYKKWWVKIVLLLSSLSAVILLLMTASRTSYAVYILSVIFMLIVQKKKRYIIPVIIVSFLLLQSFQGLYQRYANTISSVDLVVDARTGKPVGIAKKDSNTLTVEDVQSTGENLPQGSSYINLPSQQIQKSSGSVTYKKLNTANGKQTLTTTNLEGNFVVKKALAYDVSFTTRFQGEWPRAIEAFKRNILLGSGYSSISLATDGNYFRILGETGLLGFLSFFSIFMVAGIYLYRVLPTIKTPEARSFLLGTSAAMVGLMLNAILIDVFEGSKVAYSLWLLMGVSVGIVHLYQEKKINFLTEIKNLLLSPGAIATWLLIGAFGIFSMIFGNFFVADDFTWLHWIAQCKVIGYASSGAPVCQSAKTTLLQYFLSSSDFFYRPGTKVFFYVVYAIAGLNPAFYHFFSILIHFISTVAVFLISLRLLKNKVFAGVVGILFLVLSSHFEAIVWISSIGHLATAMFCLLGLLFYMYWRDGKSILFYVASLLCVFASPLFHESGIVAPVFILAYELIFKRYTKKEYVQYLTLLPFVTQIPLYLLVRQMAGAFWAAGDYRYNLAKLPYNAVGNTIGYILVSIIGDPGLSLMNSLRNYFKGQTPVAALIILIALVAIAALVWKYRQHFRSSRLLVPLFALVFFIISLAPFVGLGNMTPRYTYLSSFGVILFIVWGIETLYRKLAGSGRVAAAGVLGILLVLFSYYHITQMQQMNKDWYHAGQISSDLLSNMSYAFGTQEHLIDPVFYFVNTPLIVGHAYVFPTGLQDVLWFPFQHDYLTIHQEPSIPLALDAAEGSSSARVFRFDKEGEIEQVSRMTPTPIQSGQAPVPVQPSHGK